jgi:hypothetical protein
MLLPGLPLADSIELTVTWVQIGRTQSEILDGLGPQKPASAN